jgi:hypothetical protein
MALMTASTLTLASKSGYDGLARRQVAETLGYNTTDDFGNDGDDTVHYEIPEDQKLPRCVQGTTGFPSDGSDPDVVDLVFISQ